MNVVQHILANGLDSAPAVLHQNSVLTYAELRHAVVQFATGLLARGHRKGDRVGIFAENSPFFVKAYLGVIHAGLVAVPLQTDFPAEAFAEIVSDAGISEVFVSKRWLNRVRPWADELGLTLLSEGREEIFSKNSRIEPPNPRQSSASQSSVRGNGDSLSPIGGEGQGEGASASRSDAVHRKDLAGNPLTPFPAINPASDLAVLMFTSGSTGSPKGVMVTHRNIECNTSDIVAYLGLNAGDRVMVVLPFHYCFGLSLLHTHLLAGGSLVLNNGFKLFPETVLTEMQQQECTGFAGVPSTYQILLRNSRFRQMTFPRLRWFQQAGGKLPNPCIQEIQEAFPSVRFFLMYGQTEGTARLSYLPPDRLADKLGSIGKGLPSAKLEVLRDDGTPVVPGADEIGEIVASGDNIAQGYWRDPVETAKFFRHGRLHTGDLARVDADGFIFIVEREREMIKSGGNRVSAKEVEDVIAELPEIVEVAVIGTPHELLGEAIKAFVTPAPGVAITAQDVLAHCQKRLSAYKVPETVVFTWRLPHNSAGKLIKSKLKELLTNDESDRGCVEDQPQHAVNPSVPEPQWVAQATRLFRLATRRAERGRQPVSQSEF